MEWIDIEDRLPHKNQTVKVRIENYDKPRFATYYPDHQKDVVMESFGYAWVMEDYVPGNDLVRITHWMPLSNFECGK